MAGPEDLEEIVESIWETASLPIKVIAALLGGGGNSGD